MLAKEKGSKCVLEISLKRTLKRRQLSAILASEKNTKLKKMSDQILVLGSSRKKEETSSYA